MNDNKGKLSILCVLGFAFAILAPLIYLANPIIFFLQTLYLLPGAISLNAITMLFCRVGGFVSLILGFVLSVAGIITSAVNHKRGIGFGAAGYILVNFYLTFIAFCVAAVYVYSIFLMPDNEWWVQPYEPQETAATTQTEQIEAGDLVCTLTLNDDYSISRGGVEYLELLSWHIEHDGVQILDRVAVGELELKPEYQWLEGATGTFTVYLTAVVDGKNVRVSNIIEYTLDEAPVAHMHLYINGTEVPVTWENNESVYDLQILARDGLTIDMSDYYAIGQNGLIGQSIANDGEVVTTSPGDIVLYSGYEMIIFYGSVKGVYTEVGKIDLPEDEITALLSDGDAVITLDYNYGPAGI
ncbi:MAG: hypothetical protein II641_00645 [Clostridiales bacterium]|nr:hypothetical protein [Clostridiales bacterium]